MKSFEEIKKKYLLKLIHETRAKGNTKYRIDDILTDFGDEILDSNSVLTFQPMPKRFMVWDKRGKRWLKGRSGGLVLDLVDISAELKGSPHLPSDCQIVQSTNLFDKEGKEIFEGNIVSNGTCRAACVWDNSNAEFDFRMVKGSDQVKSWLDEYKTIGHILSNPELVEEQ